MECRDRDIGNMKPQTKEKPQADALFCFSFPYCSLNPRAIITTAKIWPKYPQGFFVLID